MATARVGAPQSKAHATPQSRAPAPSNTWAYSYALYNAASNPVDGLLLVYATILGMQPAGVAAVDSIGSLGSVLGLLIVGRMADRLGARRLVVGFLLVAAAGATVAVAVTTRPLPLIALSLVWGLVFAAPSPMASVIITRLFHRSTWADQQVRLSTLNSLGQTAGMALSVLFLVGAGYVVSDIVAVRGFFVVAAAIMLAAAGVAFLTIPRNSPAVVPAAPATAATHGRVANRAPLAREAPYNDRLKSLLLVTATMFIGVGMFSTVLPLYVSRELHAKSYVVMAGNFGFVLAATLGLRLTGRLMSRLASLRFYTVAIAGRGALLLGIVPLAVLLPANIAPLGVVALLPFMGVCAAAISASSSTRLVNLAPAGHKGGASGQYSAVTFLAMIVGSFMGAFLAEHFGFAPAFVVAAGWFFIASVLALRL